MLNSIGAIYNYDKARNNEHTMNKFSTAVGLGALAATPYLVKNIVSKNPYQTAQIGNKTGKLIEKVIKYVSEWLGDNKDINAWKTKILGNGIYKKITSTEAGKYIKEKISEITKRFSANGTVKKVTEKLTEALKKFGQSSATRKGIYGLTAAGAALFAYAGIKTITNYCKQEGAIDQKYNDMEVMNKLLE